MMPIQAVAESDRPSGVTASAPWRVKAFSILPGYRLAVRFQDGTQDVVNLSALRSAAHDCGTYHALKDPTYFAQARLALGAVTWPNGANLDPAWMHERLWESETWSVPL
jgi:hypothetical protein